MKITLKLYASLEAYLPPGAHKNQIEVEVNETATVHDILTSHNVPMETCHLILVNGHFTAPINAAEKTLSAGDALAVWPPVAGG